MNPPAPQLVDRDCRQVQHQRKLFLESALSESGGRRAGKSISEEVDRREVHGGQGQALDAQRSAAIAELASENTPTRVIGLKLGRPEAGVRAKASAKRISLRPNEPISLRPPAAGEFRGIDYRPETSVTMNRDA